MKIIAPIKRLIDHNVKVRVKADGSGVDLANVKMSMNPFDEIAVDAWCVVQFRKDTRQEVIWQAMHAVLGRQFKAGKICIAVDEDIEILTSMGPFKRG